MDVKLLKIGTTYAGKYGSIRTITRINKTHLYYVEPFANEECKTQNEKFAKWATGESVLSDADREHIRKIWWAPAGFGPSTNEVISIDEVNNLQKFLLGKKEAAR